MQNPNYLMIFGSMNIKNLSLLGQISFYTKHSINPAIIVLASCCSVFSPQRGEATTPGSAIVFDNLTVLDNNNGFPLNRADYSDQNPLKSNSGTYEYYKAPENMTLKEYSFKFVLTDNLNRSLILIPTNEIKKINLEFTIGNTEEGLRTNSIQQVGFPFSYSVDIPLENFNITDTGDIQVLSDGTDTRIWQLDLNLSDYLGNKQILIPKEKYFRLKPLLLFDTLNSNTDYILLSSNNTDTLNGEITDGGSFQLAGDTVYNPLEKLTEISGFPQIVSQFASRVKFECIDLDPDMKFQNIDLSSNDLNINVVWNNLLFFNTSSFAVRGYASVASFEAGSVPVVEHISSLEDPVCCNSTGANPEIVYPIGVSEADRENYFITTGNSSYNFSKNDFAPSDTPFFTIEKN